MAKADKKVAPVQINTKEVSAMSQRLRAQALDLRIVYASHGLVFVGMYSYDATTQVAHLDNAYNVRVFGTSAGLGQLALHGPQPETVLDYCGVVDIPLNSLVATLQCDVNAWPQ